MSPLTRYLDWRKADLAWLLALVFIVGLLPLLIGNDYYQNLLVLLFIYAGLASAWNILGGFAGQFSLGHTAFFGVGAYTSTLLYNYLGISPWLGMLAGGLISMLLGLIIAYPAFRMRGVFFAMATLAFGETVRILLIYSRNFIELPYGLSINYEPGFSRMIFADRWEYAYLTGAYLVLVLAVAFLISRSFMGFYLRAIRDNEDAAIASGIPIRAYKLIALLASAFLTSVGGTLMAQYILYIEPSTVFSVAFSVDLPLMAILGGIGTIAGPVIGAAIALPLREILLEMLGNAGSGMHLVVYGLLLVVIVVLLPHGLLGGVRSLSQRLGVGRRTPAIAPQKAEQG
ncbi:branched-chain amino acid ABC transporter permease [Rhodoligotrophos ferricapiens]|uniref:branched-chain amino acid ABC transporter permease n=1 Tax=Rhodoligotrophos ferricapiens TaxID=3069264 RepID=UPI00315CAA9F